MNDEKRPIVFSGIQPTGCITIGNYLGALKNFPALQESNDCIYCVVDQHSITVKQEPSALRKKTLELYALYLACGIDPEKSIIFIQSHVPAHSELCWALNTISYVGEISRMTQFKDKSRKHADNINMGLMDYPVLMAADILLYQTDLVPVGKDQKQHLELSRDLAQRFNSIYGETFKVPEGYIPQAGASIKSLQDPIAKMSKSDENENGYVSLTDAPEVIMRKLKRAVTDSESEIRYDIKNKPGVSNLMTIYSLFANKTVASIEKEFASKGYGDFKIAVGEAICDGLAPLQAEHKRILADKAYLESVIKNGAERANRLARKTISKVYRKLGFVQV